MSLDRDQLLAAAESDLVLVVPVSEWGGSLSANAQKWFAGGYFSEAEDPAKEGGYLLEALRLSSSPALVAMHAIVREAARVYASFLSQPQTITVLSDMLGSKTLETAGLDKAAYLLSALVAQNPTKFNEAAVEGVLVYPGSELGKLEVVANLLKFTGFRVKVWTANADRIMSGLASSSVPVVYKAAFCVWLASFDAELCEPGVLSAEVVGALNKILSTSRTEKVIRISLMAFQNFLKFKTMCEEMAECGSVDVVQQLEYEKWRDDELMELIRTLIPALSTQVKLLTNFERFEKEVKSGALKWGFIHSERFWNDNVLKCEEHNFRVIDFLMTIVRSETSSPESLAVACHDLGEFARLHPVGKAIATSRGCKDKMLELMSDSNRSVAREALLCVQKLMLNKAGDLSVFTAATMGKA